MLFFGQSFLSSGSSRAPLTRGFSNYHVVRVWSPAFLGYSANQTYAANAFQSSAKDLEPVQQYIQSHYVEPNSEYYGIAKRSQCYLCPFSEFPAWIDYKLQMEGKEYSYVFPQLLT